MTLPENFFSFSILYYSYLNLPLTSSIHGLLKHGSPLLVHPSCHLALATRFSHASQRPHITTSCCLSHSFLLSFVVARLLPFSLALVAIAVVVLSLSPLSLSLSFVVDFNHPLVTPCRSKTCSRSWMEITSMSGEC